MREKKFFGANWKMYKNRREAIEYFEKIEKKIKNIEDKKEVVFFIPFHLLLPVKDNFKNIKIGAQNFYYKDEGPFTGEISAKMLKDESIEYAIIGHSERRKIFNEDNKLLKEKIIAGLKHGIKIVFCIGEDSNEKEKGEEYKVIDSQISILDNIKEINENNFIIAYEPVWAIGTGKVAKSEDAEKIHSYIRGLINQKGLSKNIRIIYGGSVNSENIKEIMNMPNIDGVLVGSASLKVDSFEKIVFFEK
ncbi:MAG TPA: triose-phosphate isomerase [Spirochaetota bacterium]|nr:triose-phosphate isomerase [Spirochaetota bacterium]HOM37853.1 triose-phosphate isomerase [Spirochaetota bacterium]HPQ48657.1 triose-phosphate isomerase [Spirochaetota bacterium]